MPLLARLAFSSVMVKSASATFSVFRSEAWDRGFDVLLRAAPELVVGALDHAALGALGLLVGDGQERVGHLLGVQIGSVGPRLRRSSSRCSGACRRCP